MLRVFATPRNRTWTLILLAICGIAAATAGAVGIADNPPGILLAFISACALIVAFVHPWRVSKQYRYLFYGSGLGLVLFAILHNVFEVVADRLGGTGLLHGLVGGFGVVFFLAAILLCLPGLFVGAFGSVVMAIRNRHRPREGSDAVG